jgi:hypothetical protein
MLRQPECAEFMGCSVSTVRRTIRFPGGMKVISKADFARQISV